MAFTNKTNENRQKAPFEGDPTPRDLTQIARHMSIATAGSYNTYKSYVNNYQPKLESAAKFVTEAATAESRIAPQPIAAAEALAADPLQLAQQRVQAAFPPESGARHA